MPAEQRAAIEEVEEIFGYLKQSHISDKNIVKLKSLVWSANPRNAELAKIALEVALVKPHKKGRLKFLAKERKDLIEKLQETGLIFAHHY